MTAGLTILDFVALAWFAALWLGYDRLIDRRLTRRLTINQAMAEHRLAWMRQMTRRDNRITDTSLIGNAMHSVAFFASATIIVVAALLGALRAIDELRGAVAQLPFAQQAPVAAWQVKVLLLVCLFVHAFFKFSWSLRQWNYCCVMIGATPSAPVEPAEAERFARRAGALATCASRDFNSGLRTYYFALAMLAWFVHPLAFMATALWVPCVLAWRQWRSGAADVIAPTEI